MQRLAPSSEPPRHRKEVTEGVSLHTWPLTLFQPRAHCPGSCIEGKPGDC